ncbi:MAG: bi-domain-containing oxidoreductase [Deltaproteobacteria bacterium]|nr:bi-domain-containing oxidoreductase [Deltaproteobacteria bacterium]
MKQVIQSYRTGELRVADVPAPGVEPGAVLVATAASLVSIGTEKMVMDLAKKSLLGKARDRPDLVKKAIQRIGRDGVAATVSAVRSKLAQPIPLGYSLVGRVVAVGDGVAGIDVGARVACAGAKVANHAEVNLVPQNLCALVPEGVPDEVAAFVTVGAIALQGVRVAGVALGEVCAVIGLGLIGQLTVQLVKAAGGRVLGIDLDPAKVELAQRLGADAAMLRSDDVAARAAALTAGRGVDAVLITAATSSNDPVQLAGEMCRDRGRVVAVGAVGMQIPRRPYYDKELSFYLSRSYGPGRYDPLYEESGIDYPIGYVRWTEQRNMEAFLDQCAAKRLNLAPLVSHRFPIERAQEAYKLIEGGASALGIVLTYPGQPAAERTVEVPARGAPIRGDVGVSVIGAGAFASGVLAPALAKVPGVRLDTIVSARGLSARHLADKLGFSSCSTDATAALGGNTVAVVIATRHNLHASQAIAALRAGKHVFVEKPLCLSAQELDEILAERERASKLLMVGYNRRFSPLARDLAAFLAGRRAPLVMCYRVNAGIIPADSWIHDPEVGGGRIIGEICHFIDLAAFFAGAPPVRVSCQGVAPGSSARHDDNVLVTLGFGDGSLCNIAYVANGDASAGKERLEVIGDGVWAALEDFRSLELRRGGKRRVIRKLVQDKGHPAELAAFVDAIRSGGPPPIDVATLAATSRATFAAVESLRDGAPRKIG